MSDIQQNVKETFAECMNILKDRSMQYGSNHDIFEYVSKMWNTYLHFISWNQNEFEIKGKDVAILMVLFKIIREAHRHKDDNIIDAINYLALYQDMVEASTFTTYEE